MTERVALATPTTPKKMKYKITHITKYAYSDSIATCHNQVHLSPRDTPHQRCAGHRLLVHPVPAERGRRTDYFGNSVDYFSIHESHFGLSVTATSHLEINAPILPPSTDSPPWEKVIEQLKSDLSPAGLDAHQFIFDSPHVSRWQGLAEYASQSFTPGRPIVEAASDLNERIHRDFKYDPKATTVNTPLLQVFQQRRGVCQDFAHIGIGCLRSIGLPARYVSGYLRTEPPPGRARLIGADASHAWLSLYAGPLGWIDLDPTNAVTPTTDHITIAWGRDYSDVCPIQGVFVGGGQHTMTVEVDVVAFD